MFFSLSTHSGENVTTTDYPGEDWLRDYNVSNDFERRVHNAHQLVLRIRLTQLVLRICFCSPVHVSLTMVYFSF